MKQPAITLQSPALASVSNMTGTPKVLGCMFVGCGAYFILTFLYLVITNYWPGPYIDYWIDIPNVQKYFDGSLTLRDMVSAHANVHRLLIPRLLFIADYRFFDGTNTLLISISLLCKFVTVWLFYQMIKDQPAFSRTALLTLVIIAAFNAGNLSNVLHNSNMQWDLMTLFSLLSVYFYVSALPHASTGTSRTRWSRLLLALLFFFCGFFSQAGAIPVLFVVTIIAAVRKRWGHLAFNTIFMFLTLYLTFYVLPVNEPEKATYQEAAGIFVMKTYYVAIYVFKFMSHSMAQYLGNYGLYFSWYILFLLVISLAGARKTIAIANNKLLHFSIFLLFMMISIASLRVDFLPNTWWATRYQITSALLLLCLTLHTFMATPFFLRGRLAQICQILLVIHALIVFFVIHYFSYNHGYILSDRVFKSQSHMLTKGVNQYNGSALLPSLHEDLDRIAVTEPLFLQHGFAYYANKQNGRGQYQRPLFSGDSLLQADEMAEFSKACPPNRDSAHYSTEAGTGDIEIFSMLEITSYHRLTLLLNRNTYYLLDDGGRIIGFAYLHIDFMENPGMTTIRGYVKEKTATYLAEVDRQGATCLLSLKQETL